MGIIKNWQTQLRSHFLQKMLLRLDCRRHPVSFDAAQSVAILFDATDQTNKEQVIPFIDQLKKLGKEVVTVGYFNSKQDTSGFAFKAFNKNDIDWLGRPKKKVMENYSGKPFDVLICIYQNECLPIEYIAALSDAHFRVGPYTDNTYCFDLMIDTTQNNSIAHFLKEVNFYLHKINSSHESTNI